MRTLRLAAIAAFSLACGSGSPSKPPLKDPPNVFLLVPNSNVIGTELDVQITVEGCDKVSSASIQSDDGAIAKPVTYDVASGNGVPVAIGMSDVAHWKTIAGHFNLTATATCDDGRKSTSQAQPATFFPVAQVFSKADGSYVVPTAFYAEGSGASATFVGCGVDGTFPAIVRVDTTGTVLAKFDLPDAMDCNFFSSFTDPVTVAGKTIRWFITPALPGENHAGAVAFDATTLELTGIALDDSLALIPALYIGVDSDGDAVVLKNDTTHTGDWIFKISHTNLTDTNKGTLWTVGNLDPRTPQGNPVISAGTVWIPVREDTAGPSSSSSFEVEKRDYTNGALLNTNGTPQILLTEGYVDVAPNIPVTISQDGTIAYLPYDTFNGGQWTGYFAVQACATLTGNELTESCTSARFSNPALFGDGLAAVPFGPGYSYVAAVSTQFTYFLNNTNGQPIGSTLSPTGALVTTQIQPGKDQDFYILNGPGVGQWPLEVTGVDSPSTGELFRYSILADSLSIAIDDAKQPWLRISNKLVQLLPNSQYRSMLNQ